MDKAGGSRENKRRKSGIGCGPLKAHATRTPFLFLTWEPEAQREQDVPKATKPTRDRTRTRTQVSGLLSSAPFTASCLLRTEQGHEDRQPA